MYVFADEMYAREGHIVKEGVMSECLSDVLTLFEKVLTRDMKN